MLICQYYVGRQCYTDAYMDVQSWLAKNTSSLTNAGVSTARLDALVMLEDVTGKGRAWLLANPEYGLSKLQLGELKSKIARRRRHEPLAYIRGKTEFYGRDFKVNSRTLVPRPESETMIELFRSLDLPEQAVVADIGCGSGALGITAVLERPGILMNFLDIDAEALAVANHNARRHKIRGQYYQGDLLAAWPIDYDVLLCNLPYVPDDYAINKAAMFEPRIAIFGGLDGLDLYRRLFTQLASGKYGSPIVATEALEFQQSTLNKVGRSVGYKPWRKDGLICLFRK